MRLPAFSSSLLNNSKADQGEYVSPLSLMYNIVIEVTLSPGYPGSSSI
jgi:hypothetical protein